MIESALQQEAKAFFDGFVAAFATFDGELIARRYLSPYSALHVDGSVDVLSTAAEVGGYFQRIVDRYHARGCRACRYADLGIVAVGTRSVFATVRWDLLREDGTTLSSWRESYLLTRAGDRLRIFSSVDHAD